MKPYYSILVALAATALITTPAIAQIETTRRAPIEAPSEIGDAETLGIDLDAEPRTQTIYRVRAAGLVFVSFDANTDYFVTREETRSGAAQAFASADKSGNGRLSALELQAWRIKALGSAQARPANVLFDPDIDGVITEEEFTSQFLYLFESHDTNKDGKIDFAELLREAQAPIPRRKEEKPRRSEADFPDPFERRNRQRRRGY